MSITLQISRKANEEYLELLEWYGEIDIILVQKFADDFFTTLNRLNKQPTHYSFIAPNLRRIPFLKFQTMIIYQFKDNIINVLSVKDMRSKPNRNFY